MKRVLVMAGLMMWTAILVAGCTSVLELKTGQCFDSPGTGSVSTVQTIDCTKEHLNEVFAVIQYPAGKDDPYPGDQVVKDRANSDCPPAFLTYVGKAFDTSELEILFLTPSSDTWKSGDRAIVCTLSLPNGAKATSSLKGSDR
jgi:hypothetical protein